MFGFEAKVLDRWNACTRMVRYRGFEVNGGIELWPYEALFWC